MGTEDFRKMIEGGDIMVPAIVRTRGGRSYVITHPSNIHISEAYPDTAVVLVRGKGVIMLALEAIDAIQHEYEPARLGG
jgi:hypothetical protein